MSSKTNVRHNLLANFFGRGWTLFLNFLFVPIYVGFLGIEAYGLIGFYVSLMIALMFLDLGLGATLTRELARMGGASEGWRNSRGLLRTLEILSWCLGIAVGGAVALSAPFIAHDWLTTKELSAEAVVTAVRLMGLIIALQWPALLYSGGFNGLQRQVRLNVIRVSIATLQAGGAIFVLWAISPTIEAFFLWQAATGTMQVGILAYGVWSIMPSEGGRASFRWDLLRGVWRFAAGVTGISISISILTQVDKLIVGKYVSLDLLACYTLAFLVAGIINSSVSPFQIALMPKFTELFARNNTAALVELYHRCCQIIAVIVFPVAAIVFAFPQELLQAWIRDPFTATNTAEILSVVVLGATLNAVMALPYTLQLASGWTALSFYKNLIAMILLVPALLILVPKAGAMGGALAWLSLNLGYYLFEIPIMHRRLFPREMWRWYLIDTLVPLCCCFALTYFLRFAVPQNLSGIGLLLAIGLIYVAVLGLALLVLPYPKEMATKMMRRCFNWALLSRDPEI